jgi:hypothetical protein
MATLQIGVSVPSKIQVGNELVKEVWLGPIKLWPAVSGGVVTLFDYTVLLVTATGGSVTFTMKPDGTTEGDAQGWYSPRPMTGIGTGKWVVLIDLGGGLVMSGSPRGTRLELNAQRQWTGTGVGGGVTKLRNFRVEIWDAAVGGSLLATGSLVLEIDGTN